MSDSIMFNLEERGCQTSRRIWECLALWRELNPQFAQFMKDNEKTIGKKFRNAKEPEDKCDVLAELETAYYLTSNRDTAVEYEPKPSFEHSRSVDFLVTIKQDVQFTIEVKRIRKTEPERQLAELIDYLVSNIEAIPSSLGFGFRMTPHGDVP